MIHTSIEIAAPPKLVRKILLDFTAIPKWHTGFITTIQAEDAVKPIEKGDTISGTMGGVNFKAEILECSPSMFSWTGPPVAGLFRGIHVFRFRNSSMTEGGTIFEQEESFVGIMAWAFSPYLPLGLLTKSHFNKFNAELKAEAEKQQAGMRHGRSSTEGSVQLS